MAAMRITAMMVSISLVLDRISQEKFFFKIFIIILHTTPEGRLGKSKRQRKHVDIRKSRKGWREQNGVQKDVRERGRTGERVLSFVNVDLKQLKCFECS